MVRKISTKVEVAELVGCVFAIDKVLDYCAQIEYKMSYAALSPQEQAAGVQILARERFMAFGLLKTAGASHDKIKSDLSDDYTKVSDNYPVTPQQTLLLLDKYSKKLTLVTPLEGTSFFQKGKKGDGKKSGGDKVKFDKEFYKDKECFRCGKKGHPKAACTVKLTPADDDDKSTKSTKSSTSKGSSRKGSSKSNIGKMFGEMNNTIKTLGKAMSQVSEEFEHLNDNESIGAQSHAQGAVLGSRGYAFASQSKPLRGQVLLGNQSSVHVFCNQDMVGNIRKAERQLELASNGGNLPIDTIANINGFEEAVWFLGEAMTNILSLAVVKQEYKVIMTGMNTSSTVLSRGSQT
jgi:hypothetical protein